MIDEIAVADRSVALLLSVAVGGGGGWRGSDEFVELAASAGVKNRGLMHARRTRPDPRYFIGSGKAEEVRRWVRENGVPLLIVDHDLTPGQERNLESRIRARVLDRTGLILDIFSQRAQSHEGKLQVELAQLEYLSTRLVRGWSHLERQKGGIGLRGPGEKQLETDRRLLRRRMDGIARQLERIERQRRQRRRRRRKNALFSVALVGYTNAGKSTLFRALTESGAAGESRMFATLDPLVRRLHLPGGAVLIGDTVGFIRNLPHELIEAFNATLLEVRQSDLIVHVEDASDPDCAERRHQVEAVLASIGAADIPKINVFNKIDRIGEQPCLVRSNGAHADVAGVRLSALSGQGLDLLKRILHERLSPRRRAYRLEVPVGAPALRAFLYDNGSVLSERYVPGAGWSLRFELEEAALRKLQKRFGRVAVCAGGTGADLHAP